MLKARGKSRLERRGTMGELVEFDSEDEDDYDMSDPHQRLMYLSRRENIMRARWAQKYPDLEDPMGVIEKYVDEEKIRLTDLFFAVS